MPYESNSPKTATWHKGIRRPKPKMTEFEGTEFGIVQRVARFGAKAICLEALLPGPSKLMGDRRDVLGPGHQSRRKASSKFNLFNVRIPTLTG